MTEISLERRAHSYAVSEAKNLITGSITLTTNDNIEDEVAVADLVTALIQRKQIPVFGHGFVLVKSIGFTWTLTDNEKTLYGDEVRAIIRATYVTETRLLSGQVIDRLIEDYQANGKPKTQSV